MKMAFKVILLMLAFAAINGVAIANDITKTEVSPNETADTSANIVNNADEAKSNERICVSVKLGFQFNWTYETIDNKSATVLYNISVDTDNLKNTTACNESYSPWIWKNETSNMTIHYKADAKTLTLTEIHMFINVSEIYKSVAAANESKKLDYHSENGISIPIEKSYFNTSLPFKSSSGGNETINITISNLRLEAFNEDTKAVPIIQSNTAMIAGVSILIVLIMIAIIAFVIFWRREQVRAVWSTLNCTVCSAHPPPDQKETIVIKEITIV